MNTVMERSLNMREEVYRYLRNTGLNNPDMLDTFHQQALAEYGPEQAGCETNFLNLLNVAIQHGEHFLVEKSFGMALKSLATTMPVETKFDASLVPTSVGWVAFEEPILDVSAHPIGLLLWASIGEDSVAKNPDGKLVKLHSGQFMACLATPPHRMSNGLWMIEEFTLRVLEDERSLTDCITSDKQQTDTFYAGQRLLYSFFYLIQQRISGMEPTAVRGEKLSRIKRQNGFRFTNEPHTILLRRLNTTPSGTDDESKREFHCQWLVGAHFRLQPYRSNNTVKLILIDPYIKGPADKPFKPPTPRVYVARR